MVQGPPDFPVSISQNFHSDNSTECAQASKFGPRRGGRWVEVGGELKGHKTKKTVRTMSRIELMREKLRQGTISKSEYGSMVRS